MKPIYLLIFVSLSLAGCQQQPSKAEQAYQKQLQNVFDVHDVVMGKMGKMGMLIDSLSTKIDSTQAGKPYQKAQDNLKQANHAMMNWMKDFGKKFPNAIDDTTHYSKEEYKTRTEKLKKEETAIKAVQDRVNKSIARAEKLLKN